MKTWKNKELLRIGWQKTKANLWFLIALEVIIYFCNFLGQEAHIGFLVSLFTTFVLVSVVLRISRDQKVDFNYLFDDMSGNKLVHYFLSMIILTILIVAGIVLFIVPGIIISIFTCFTVYILLDMKKDVPIKSLAFWGAIKESFEMTKGIRMKLFLMFLVLTLINLVGAVLLLVGLLVTVPITTIALATLYNRLKNVSVVEPVGNVSASLPSETVS